MNGTIQLYKREISNSTKDPLLHHLINHKAYWFHLLYFSFPIFISLIAPCYKLNCVLPTPNLLAEALSANISVWSKEAIKVKWEHKSGAFTSQISVFLRRNNRELTPALYHVRTQQDSICLQAKKTALAISKSANILILNFLGSRTGRKKLRCLSYPICGIVLWQPWQSKAPLLTSWLPALWVLPCSKLSSALPSEWPSTHKVSGHLSASYHLEDKTHTQVLSLYLNPATILNTFLFSEQAIPACLPAYALMFPHLGICCSSSWNAFPASGVY